ncbi:cell division protein FtsQ/DivIB [Hansschlegelia quercus]|nr:cell division protein FtsQ/DivIB [Hansschlegelia quercus]
MRATHEGGRVRRSGSQDFDEMLGASRSTNLRLKLARLARKRRLGLGLTALFYASVGVLGMIDGGHWPAVKEEALNLHITTANALGFRVLAVQTEGQSALTDDEVLLALGIKDDTALPFLDVKAARERLMANPLVAEATVRKLYPDRVTVHLTERKPFALWQHDGKVQILADDGTPIDEFRDSRFAHLPLVVGPLANTRAQTLLAALDAAPKIKAETYAAVLVAERRWNLRLRSGVEVKLPETGFAEALGRLEVMQDRDNVLAKWIDVVDMREADRTIVRLAPEAAAMAEEADKAAAKAAKKKGGQT